MRVVVSGGGTGGHISPILAVVSQLKTLDPDVDILYIGTADGPEAAIAKSAGLAFAAIPAGKYRRYQGLRLYQKLLDLPTVALNLRDVGRVLKGFVAARRVLKRFRPDVLFLKGGYVSLPVGLAARTLGLPYLIHESDTVPGLTNRVLAGYARQIAVGWPTERYTEWKPNKLIYVGSPVREELLAAHPLEGRQLLGLTADLPVVLVIGGSSGAAAVNTALVGALPQLLSHYQVVHIAGEQKLAEVRERTTALALAHADRYHLHSFLGKEIGPAFAAADVVVSRGGANVLAELAALGKAAIIIPAKQLRDQATNAQVMSRASAVRVITEDKLTPGLLREEIDRILGDSEVQRGLEQHIRAFAKPHAARELAGLIIALGGGGEAAPSGQEGRK